MKRKVIDYIRRYHENAMISIGLTDQQGATPSKQYDAVSRGYQNGHSDILITNRHIEFTGLEIELKTLGPIFQNSFATITAHVISKSNTLAAYLLSKRCCYSLKPL